MLRFFRIALQNDGVVIYVKNTLQHQVKEIKLTQASCLQVDVLNNTILCIYRSPSVTNAESFINSLSSHIETISRQKNIIVAGDININIIPKPIETSYEHSNRINYLNMLSVLGILTGHTFPTRIRNCLDHFMLKINPKKNTAFIAVLQTSITDHLTTFLCLSKLKPNIKISKIKTKTNYEDALKYLQNTKLSELLFCDDPNIVTESLISKLTESLTENTTTTTIPKSKRIIKPWITTGILRCINNRNNLQKNIRKDPYNEVLKITYTRYRNFCNNLIKKLKRKYERNLVAKSVTNNKLLWKNIKNLTYTNKIRNNDTELINSKSSPTEACNLTNTFFANIGKELANKIQPCLPSADYLHSLPIQPNSLVLLDADCNEVDNILMSLRSDSAPGWDNIPICFLKLARHEVVPVITHLGNICFRTGIFPTALKASIITPVYKGGERDDVSNYRPISVLSAISKILEKMVNGRLLNYLNKFNIISPSQFGFRQGVSTEDAVTALTTLVTEQLDKGNRCLSVFIDLKKAFDTVSFPILVCKLERIGIRETALSLFKSYLMDRKQKVKLGQHTSDDADISYGVPQGSVLGPTLFLIYINDLCNLKLYNANIFSYADDTAIVFTGGSWDSVKIDAEQGLAKVAIWLNNNLLTLNTTKTNFICYSIYKNKQPNNNFSIKIHTCNNKFNNCNCSSIDKVTQTKYLGVIIDQHLTWYSHIEQVSSRVRKLIWIFKSLRHILPRKLSDHHDSSRNLLNEMYVALVQSILGYCIPIWGGAAKTRFIEVERAQRALIKVMYFKKYRFPTTRLYQISKLLSVRKLYILQIILKKHKHLHFDSKIYKRRITHKAASLPNTKTKFASIQYCKRSAILYNKLNKELDIYSKHTYECKKTISNWLQPLTYETTESMLISIQ